MSEEDLNLQNNINVANSFQGNNITINAGNIHFGVGSINIEQEVLERNTIQVMPNNMFILYQFKLNCPLRRLCLDVINATRIITFYN